MLPLSILMNWYTKPGSRIKAVPCIRHEALSKGGTSLIDWSTTPALETANSATPSSAQANIGVAVPEDSDIFSPPSQRP